MSDDEADVSYFGDLEDLPEPESLPRTSRGQSCAICGATTVTWLHPLAKDHVGFRVDGRGYTLPTFWTLCGTCETLHVAGEDVEVLRRMRRPGVDDAASQELAQMSLVTFRRADLGGRAFGGGAPQGQ